MATKRTKKPEFPTELYVYIDTHDETPLPIASKDIEETVDNMNPSRSVGVYQLVEVVTVKRNVEILMGE